jgi:hypothetical protein
MKRLVCMLCCRAVLLALRFSRWAYFRIRVDDSCFNEEIREIDRVRREVYTELNRLRK